MHSQHTRRWAIVGSYWTSFENGGPALNYSFYMYSRNLGMCFFIKPSVKIVSKKCRNACSATVALTHEYV